MFAFYLMDVRQLLGRPLKFSLVRYGTILRQAWGIRRTAHAKNGPIGYNPVRKLLVLLCGAELVDGNRRNLSIAGPRSGGAELANSQSFLKELCDLLGVPHPEPTQSDEEKNEYVFEKAIQFNNGDGTYSVGRVDLYRANCFVLESKQGVERKDAEALRHWRPSRKKSDFGRDRSAKIHTMGPSHEAGLGASPNAMPKPFPIGRRFWLSWMWAIALTSMRILPNQENTTTVSRSKELSHPHRSTGR